MTDIVKDWMLTIGASRQDCHKVSNRMNFLCKYYNLRNPGLSKKVISKMLVCVANCLDNDRKMTREKFISNSLLALEPKCKWDLKHIAFCRSSKFYQSSTWKNLRVKALAVRNSCVACGRSPTNTDEIILHVDHILPRSIYPEYALNINNLQILCADCNIGKGNTLEKKF